MRNVKAQTETNAIFFLCVGQRRGSLGSTDEGKGTSIEAWVSARILSVGGVGSGISL